MALHRDIYWVGRQWAVTGYGVQACNQKQRGGFDIEGARLWEDGVLERFRGEAWFNSQDFDKALEVARKYYPEPPRKEAPPKPPVAAVTEVSPKEIPKQRIPGEAPRPAAQKFAMRVEGWPAKLVKPWRIRMR
jgi:hypothetical protein